MSVLELDHRRRAKRRLDIIPCFTFSEETKEPDRDIIKSFVKNYFGPVLFSPLTQVALLVLYISLIMLSFGSYNQLNLGLSPQVTAIDGSALYHYF